MSNRFAIADPHFSHPGTIRFAGKHGGPLRPWGRVADKDEMPDDEMQRRVSEMDEAMVANWNRVVGPKDIVEVLGDVVMNRRYLPILGRLNGRKRLRMGNHDIFTKKWNADYAPYFEEITAYKVMSDLILSHIPLHPESVKQRWLANVHGHLHDGQVMREIDDDSGWGPEIARWVPDDRYLCVSVEQIDYTPISFDEVYARIRERQARLA